MPADPSWLRDRVALCAGRSLLKPRHRAKQKLLQSSLRRLLHLDHRLLAARRLALEPGSDSHPAENDLPLTNFTDNQTGNRQSSILRDLRQNHPIVARLDPQRVPTRIPERIANCQSSRNRMFPDYFNDPVGRPASVPGSDLGEQGRSHISAYGVVYQHHPSACSYKQTNCLIPITIDVLWCIQPHIRDYQYVTSLQRLLLQIIHRPPTEPVE